MDGTRFDDITRSLSANRTRRQAMKSAAAPALGGMVARLAAPAAMAARKAVVRCQYDATTISGSDYVGRHAQVFKATQTGKLSEVKVRIIHRHEPAGNLFGDYVAKIARVDAAGVPDDTTPLAEKSFPEADLLTTEQTITFSFGGAAPKVQKGKRYAVVISRPEGGRLNQMERRIPDGDPCPGSVLYANSSATGGTFNRVDGFDMVFAAVIKYR
jgi:hypothetical protein